MRKLKKAVAVLLVLSLFAAAPGGGAWEALAQSLPIKAGAAGPSGASGTAAGAPTWGGEAALPSLPVLGGSGWDAAASGAAEARVEALSDMPQRGDAAKGWADRAFTRLLGGSAILRGAARLEPETAAVYAAPEPPAAALPHPSWGALKPKDFRAAGLGGKRRQDPPSLKNQLQLRLQSVSAANDAIPAARKAREQDNLKVLELRRDQLYDTRKLSEAGDLQNPALDDLRARAIEKLEGEYDVVLSKNPTRSPGLADAVAYRSAELDALASGLDRVGPGPRNDGKGPGAVLQKARESDLAKLAGDIEALRNQAAQEFAGRRQLSAALEAASAVRNGAVGARHDGSKMGEFRKNFARLATVMDLSYSLNILNAAETAIAGMQVELERKMQAIGAGKQVNAQALQQAQQNLSQIATWQSQAHNDLSADRSQAASFAKLARQAKTGLDSLNAFKSGLEGLLQEINAQDGGKGGSAPVEYRRRLDLIPRLVVQATEGGGAASNSPANLSLKFLNDQLAYTQGQYDTAQARMPDLQSAPPEVGGALIVQVPPIPPLTGSPDPRQTLQQLESRRAYFQSGLDYYQGFLDNLNRSMSEGDAAVLSDSFGDLQPESYVVWQGQEEKKAADEESQTRSALAQMDAAAASIPGSGLPRLASLGRDQLVRALPDYPAKLNVLPPAAGDDAAFNQQMAVLQIGRSLPLAARHLILWSKAQATYDQLFKGVHQILPTTIKGLGAVAGLYGAVLQDVKADEAVVQAHAGGRHLSIDEGAQIKTRKVALMSGQIIPGLEAGIRLIRDVLIPFQNDSIASLQSATGSSLTTLYQQSLSLYNQTDAALHRTFPWQLASNGGPVGETGASLASIDQRKQFFQRNLDFIEKSKTEARNRLNPNFEGTETTLGKDMPYSLPRRIDKYKADKQKQADAFNRAAGEINAILAQMDQQSGGKYNLLASYAMPAGIQASGQASVDAVQSVISAGRIQSLGARLTQIGQSADLTGGIDLGGDGLTPPVGQQSPPHLTPGQQLALLALQTAKRLVPSTGPSPLGLAAAEYLFDDAVVQGSQKFLDGRLKDALAFLSLGESVLRDSLTDLDINKGYIGSDLKNEDFGHFFSRETAMIRRQGDFAAKGLAFFQNEKEAWDQETLDSFSSVHDYYAGLGQLNQNGAAVDDQEAAAIQAMQKVLRDKLAGFEARRQEVLGWLRQLNNADDSALRRLADSAAEIQAQTRAVLEANYKFRDQEELYKKADAQLRRTVAQLADKQRQLDAELLKTDLGRLPEDLRRKVEGASPSQGAWMLPSPSAQGSTLAVEKSQFPTFLDKALGALFGGAVNPGQDLGALKTQILADPSKFAQLLPGSQVIPVGDGPDGFYLIYQTDLGLGGAETGSQVTLGNITQILGNNFSLNGYKFISPPSASNAPVGDQGVSVGVESLQGKNWVNYLDLDLHKFLQDIPSGPNFAAERQELRVMVFEDFALLVADGKLYVGLTGYGDVALHDAANKPSYLGGSFKTELKLTEVTRLTFEQQELLAKDPRAFLETVNLDFTGWDPSLAQSFPIAANANDKDYSRTKAGVGVDVGRAAGWQAPFDVQLYWARTAGTDDVNQQALGASVLTGVSITKNVKIDDRATVEIGQKSNTYSDRLDIALPAGFAVFAQGTLVGPQQAAQMGISKQLGTHSRLSAAYGSPYLGLNDRLSLSLNSQFTLSELWRSAAKESAEALQGGAALKAYNKQIEDLFAGRAHGGAAAELQRVFKDDVGRQLLTQGLGGLTRDLEDLYRAGAVFDNTRVTGMLGFVSNPVGGSTTDLATGGGLQAGTNMQMSLSRAQKAVVEKTIGDIYLQGSRLQARMVRLAKDWQQAVCGLVMARWELKLAQWAAANAPSNASRSEEKVRLEEARGRLDQALLRYDLLTGRGPNEPPPFDDVTPDQLQAMMADIGRLIAAPDRLGQVLRGLDPEALAQGLPREPHNLILAALPFIEKLTLNVGFQLQNALGSQLLGAGATIRIPVYDPGAKDKEKSYELQDRASQKAMLDTYQSYRLKAQQERIEAVAWSRADRGLEPGQPASAQYVGKAIAAYRNGLIPESVLWSAFDEWQWYTRGVLQARSNEALARNSALLDGVLAPEPEGQESVKGFASLTEAIRQAEARSPSLSELELKAQASQAAMAAADHRYSGIHVDINLGSNAVATGVGLLGVGLTGIGVYPSLGFKLTPQALRELEVEQGKDRRAFFAAARDKARGDLAVELHEAYATMKTSVEQEALYRQALIPQLSAALKRARDELASGQAAQADVEEARLALSRAQSEALQVQSGREQAMSSFNYLLGRPLNAPVRLELGLAEAQAQLDAYLAALSPLAAARRVLAERLAANRAYEHEVDNNQKASEITADPVSLVISSLGRLIHALADEPYAAPDQVAWAREQVLLAEKDQENFERRLPLLLARVRSQLAFDESSIQRLAGRADAASKIAVLGLGRDAALRKAQLSALSEGPGSSAPVEQPLPKTYDELAKRLAQAAQDTLELGGDPAAGVLPESDGADAKSYARFYALNPSLGGDPMGKSYVETWAELRLMTPGADPQTLAELARFVKERGERRAQEASQDAAIRARAALAKFGADVRLWRWAQSSPESLELRRSLEAGLQAQGAQLGALLGLPPGAPFAKLAELVPDDGPQSPEALGQKYLGEVRRLNLEAVRLALYPDGLPAAAREQDLLSQAQADAVISRMSYQGFTPLAAFGYFRNQFVGGAFLEAPDPADIERALSNVLGQALRRELEQRGELKQLALRLHSLMAAVRDGARLVEAQQKRLEASRLRYRQALAGLGKGWTKPQELDSARAELDASLAELAASLSKIRSDFEELVGELKALNLPAGAAAPAQAPSSELALGQDPGETLLNFWASRNLDADFAAKQDAALERLGLSEGDRAALRALSARYRDMSEKSALVRGMDFSAAEKLDLLARADVEGRRLELKAGLKTILDSAGGLGGKADPKSAQLREFLSGELEAGRAQAKEDGAQYRWAMSGLRDSLWAAQSAPARLNALYKRLNALRDAADGAWAALQEAYLAKNQGAGDFVLKDLDLDAWLKARIELDRQIVAAFASPELRGRPGLARVMDGLFDFKAAAERQKRFLRYGRGALALDALVDLGKAKASALRFEGAAPAELNAAEDLVSRLSDMRDSWQKSPRQIDPLYAAVGAGADGRPDWNAAAWLTPSDLELLKSQGKLVFKDGKTWLKSDGGLLQVVGGSDVKAHDLELARQKERDQQVQKELGRSDFAFLKDGKALGLSYEAFQKAVAEGRLLFFAAEADDLGLHERLHPLQAQLMAPSQYTAVLYDGDKMPQGAFPTLESLAGLAGFARVSTGSKGLDHMIGAVEAHKLANLRAGWLALKLHTYGFKLSAAGEVLDVFLSDKEFSEAQKPNLPLPEGEGRGEGAVFYKSSDLRWGLNAEGTLVRVEAPNLQLVLGGTKEVPETWVTGAVLAVELDAQGRVLQVYSKSSELATAAKGWTLIDANGSLTDPDKAKVAAGQRQVSPNFRLARYEGGTQDHPTSIVLGLGVLTARLDKLEGELGAVKHWAFMPQNWANILLETPRGIVQIPLEMLTGMDPTQQGYLGRVQMLRTEGGATDHRGFWMTLAHLVDILDLLPDPVTRFHDPSQFPGQVGLDAPLGDGFVFDKAPRAGDKDIHVGRGNLQRQIDQEQGDLNGRLGDFGGLKGGLKDRVLAYFAGGVERTYVETLRGRGADWQGGNYNQSRSDAASGQSALGDAYRDVLGSPDGRAVDAQEPGNLETSRIESRTEIRVGDKQYEEGLGRMRKERDGLKRDLNPSVEQEVARDRAELEAAVQEARKARDADDPVLGPADAWNEETASLGEQAFLEKKLKEAASAPNAPRPPEAAEAAAPAPALDLPAVSDRITRFVAGQTGRTIPGLDAALQDNPQAASALYRFLGPAEGPNDEALAANPKVHLLLTHLAAPHWAALFLKTAVSTLQPAHPAAVALELPSTESDAASLSGN